MNRLQLIGSALSIVLNLQLVFRDLDLLVFIELLLQFSEVELPVGAIGFIDTSLLRAFITFLHQRLCDVLFLEHHEVKCLFLRGNLLLKDLNILVAFGDVDAQLFTELLQSRLQVLLELPHSSIHLLLILILLQICSDLHLSNVHFQSVDFDEEVILLLNDLSNLDRVIPERVDLMNV